jgi:hypothetical protein
MPSANPYALSHTAAYRGRIESAAGVEIIVQLFADDDEDFGGGCFARAVTDDDFAAAISIRTVASAFCNTEIAALDSLAQQLGVFDRLHADAKAA